jgi:hypothetical protein
MSKVWDAIKQVEHERESGADTRPNRETDDSPNNGYLTQVRRRSRERLARRSRESLKATSR